MSTEDHQVEIHGIKLKLMVDKVRNRVVFAEAGHEFIDIILSFLTLPLGTIVKLLGEDIVHMGSINRIYENVSSLDTMHFRTPTCLYMLLNPKNAAEVECKKLKINIDPFPDLAGNIYKCNCSQQCWSIYPRLSCDFCGVSRVYTTTIEEEKSRSGDGVFVKGRFSTFMVTDDLQIIPSSTANVLALFKKLGINDRNRLEERTIAIGSNKVLQLLKFSLLSNSAFTNAFLHEKGVIEPVKFLFKEAVKSEKTLAQNSSITMKLLMSRTTKRVLYAEAGVDVVDLLFSFLMFPLGAVIKLLGESSRLGCIDNLYKAAQESSTTINIKSNAYKAMLISPKLYPHFSYENHPLEMNEYVQFVRENCGRIRFQTIEQGVSTSNDASKAKIEVIKMMDFKSPHEETDSGIGYMRGPETFMITDSLVVTHLSPIMCISQLNELNISSDDVEERVVTIGKEEALSFLRASLISKSVLNDVFRIQR